MLIWQALFLLTYLPNTLTFCRVHRISVKKMRPNRKAKQKKEIITKPASSRNRRDHMMFRGGNPRSCQTKTARNEYEDMEPHIA